MSNTIPIYNQFSKLTILELEQRKINPYEEVETLDHFYAFNKEILEQKKNENTNDNIKVSESFLIPDNSIL